jgi:hypothetical protein
MKKIIFCFLFVFVFIYTTSLNSKCFIKKPKMYKKCLFGFYYYTWKDKPIYLAIPVIDKDGNLIKCIEKN